MARRARAEVEGGLYHVITRGVNRRQMFDAPADYEKFLSPLGVQKARLPFFLYAYCLMTNHVHLLIERQADTIGRIMPITRGNNRRQIFNSPADHERFLSTLAVQKTRLPFFLYSYCLMSNHVHLLIECQNGESAGRLIAHLQLSRMVEFAGPRSPHGKAATSRRTPN